MPAAAQMTRRVSVDAAGAQGAGLSTNASFSADGRYIAFASLATNLVPGDTNGLQDVFVHDRLTGATERISVDSSGTEVAATSSAPSISADGRYVAFESYAALLVPGDTNGNRDVFVRDRQNGTTSRVSVNSAGVQGDFESYAPSISADGRYVTFVSYASNLIPGSPAGNRQTYVRDRVSGTTERVSVSSAGVPGNLESFTASISADGRYVAFESLAYNLVPGTASGTGRIYVRDRQSATTAVASVSSTGVSGNGSSSDCSISADGRYVAFESVASNLVPGDTNGFGYDIFVRDLQSGVTERVSLDSAGAQVDSGSRHPRISADGRYVAFESLAANLIPGDTNGSWDGFVRDRQNAQTGRVSVDSSGAQANASSSGVSVSSDGRYAVFTSLATDLVPGDTNGASDVFLRDRQAGIGSAFTTFCSGDGSSGACPCGNGGSAFHGCANSAFVGGAGLSASGTASVSADSVSLSAADMTGSIAVFFQGATATPATIIDDGLGCVGGPIIRLGTKSVTANSGSFPQPGDPSISVRGAIPPAGGLYRYQTFYRNAVTAFCPPATSNRTNAVMIAWIP